MSRNITTLRAAMQSRQTRSKSTRTKSTRSHKLSRRRFTSAKARSDPTSRGGPVCPKAGLSIPTRAYQSRGLSISPEVVLPDLRRACQSRDGSICTEAVISVLGRARQSRGRSICPEGGQALPKALHVCKGKVTTQGPSRGHSKANL